jgi:hypothetical protein
MKHSRDVSTRPRGARASLNMTEVIRSVETSTAAEQIPRAKAALGMARSGEQVMEDRECVHPTSKHRQECLSTGSYSAAEGGCGPQYSLTVHGPYCESAKISVIRGEGFDLARNTKGPIISDGAF